MNALPERVLRKIEFEPMSGCWLWTGSIKTPQGYAQVSWNNYPSYGHRLIFELLVGPIPTGYELDHLCRVRRCVNPGHLEPVLHAVNMQRGMGPSAILWRTGLCAAGHPQTEANLYLRGNGGRTCAPCSKRRAKEWGAANKEHVRELARTRPLRLAEKYAGLLP